MAGRPVRRARLAALAQAAAASTSPPEPSNVPLVAGAAGIDIKVRSNGAAGCYGLTAWSERGRDFIQQHVLSLRSAGVSTDTVWFDDAEAPAVQSALRGSGLALVMGIGPQPDVMDQSATADWSS